jgi:hydroxymethylpyrimidine/phosphomethylpyrimidine kinase
VLFKKLKNKNIDIWDRYTKHIFANKLVNQTLVQKSFDFYIEQDYYYLLVYFDAIKKLAEFPNAAQCFKPIADGVKLELEHHEKSNNTKIKPSKATIRYIDYLKNLIKNGSYEELLIAIAPCLVGYYELGIYINSLKICENNRYIDWIKLYQDDDYKKSSDACTDLVNGLQNYNFEKLNAIFSKAIKLEIAFFDQVVDFYSPPTVLTIAGSDSSGGAGIQADIKAISANKCYGASVITTITAQSTSGVTDIFDLPSSLIENQFNAVANDLDIKYIKIGMLNSVDIINSVHAVTKNRSIPYVLDPVMIAKDETKLLKDNAIELLKSTLLKNAYVITPNIPEAEVLTGLHVKDLESMKIACIKLKEMGTQNILLKGGHLEKSELVDVLYFNEKFYYYRTPKLMTKNTHGTGCTLSSALASYLASGYSLDIACQKAIDYVQKAIISNFKVGKGRGPVNHFYKECY